MEWSKETERAWDYNYYVVEGQAKKHSLTEFRTARTRLAKAIDIIMHYAKKDPAAADAGFVKLLGEALEKLDTVDVGDKKLRQRKRRDKE